MDNFLNLFAFASGCSVITIAFVYFSENKKKADLFVSFAICFFWGLDTLLLLSNDIAFYTHYPHLLYISEPFELFFGPLIYYRFRILIEGKMKFSLLTVFLFLPGVLAVIFFIPFYMLDPLEKLAYLGFHNIQNGLIRNIYLVIVNGQTPWFYYVLFFLLYMVPECYP